MAEKQPQEIKDCPEEKVYVLEGNPDEVYNAQGEKLELTPEQKALIEEQI